jgi:UDP:flavonoid glycosyltransferase YjiC (YdhE family)
MRVLFSTTAGTGHFGPLIPFAKACAAAGHTVAVAAPGRFAGAVTGAGFTTHLPFDEPPRELVREVFGRISQPTFEEMNRVMVAEMFGRLAAQAALPALTKIMSDWRPDVVIRETCEFGSLVAAERAGVAQLHVAITMGRIGPGFVGLLETSLSELSTMAGLPPERGAELLLHGDSLTSVPAALDSGDLTLGESEAEPATEDWGRIWRFRTDAPAEARLPAAWGNPDEPLVYVSYGSVTARQPEFAPIYDATLRALADLPIRVLMTTGLSLEPADLEPIPPNSHVEQWWPQEAVMGEAAAMVGHGGFGTTMAALSAGVPQVVLPLFSFDQAVNARPVAEVNAGIELPGGVGAVADLPAALRKVLDDPAFTEGARAMAAEIAALPDISACLPILEQLATERSKGDLDGD